MKVGYTLAIAGVAVVLVCGVAAFSPLDQLLSSASTDTAASTAAATDTQYIASAAYSLVDEPCYRDDVYRATAQGRCGTLMVTVTIENGAISAIQVGQNYETQAMLEKAEEVVIPQIIEQQSTDDIETATGATVTSNAIIEAVSSILERAAIDA